MENIVLYVILGVFAGILAGMGLGGGNILIPLLILICSFEQILAQSVNLVAFIPMSIVALVIHLKNKLVCYKTAFKIIAVALIGCFLGVLILNFIDVAYLRILYSIFLVCIGVWLLIEARKTKCR